MQRRLAADTPARWPSSLIRFLIPLTWLACAPCWAQAASAGWNALARGYQAWDEKRFVDAAAQLRQARQGCAPVCDYADFYLASALQNTGAHAEAIPILKGFAERHPESHLIPRATIALATALLAVHESGQAAALLSSRHSLLAAHQPATDLLLARAYEASGQEKAALRVFREIYYGAPASEEAEEAAKRKAQFAKPDAQMLRARADGLFAARQYAAAQTAYRELAEAGEGGDHGRVRSAACLLRLGRVSAARTALLPLRPANPEAAAERLYLLAECERRLRRSAEFFELVRQLGARYPLSPWYEEALFSAGNHALVTTGALAAAPYYAELAEKFPEGRYAPQSHWKVAWTRYRQNDRQAAWKLMRDQFTRYPNTALAPAAMFWSGRLAEQLDPPAAKTLFTRAVETYPSSFYGLLARKQIGAGGGFRNAAPKIVAPPEDSPRRQKAVALTAVGLADLAAWEMRQSAAADPERQVYWYVELAKLERDRDRHRVSMEYARKALPSFISVPVDREAREIWELLFPLPWWPDLKQAAAAEGLDPYLVAALIRQESAFDERAVSRARAIGLMQILPSTGRKLARQLGLRPYSTASLYRAKVSLRLGTRYLRDMIEEHRGRLEDALAAYNAGPHRVVAWRKEQYGDEWEFVESIPFTETREYVQIVLRNAEIYRALYPGGNGPVSAGN